MMAKIYDYIDTALAKHKVTIEEAQKSVAFFNSKDSIAYRVHLQKLLNHELEQMVESGDPVFMGAVKNLKKVLEVPVKLQNQITNAEKKEEKE